MLLILLLFATNMNLPSTASGNGGLWPVYTQKQTNGFTSRTRPTLTLPTYSPSWYPTSGFHPVVQYLYEEEQEPANNGPSLEEVQFEPIVSPVKKIQEAGIECDQFHSYAFNCTRDSAIIYNSSSKSPPMPAKMAGWCKAIRLLTNCAIDWNSECKDVTESHFNEESIKGHMHVVNNICDNEWFLAHYDTLPSCIDKVASAWEKCYEVFKSVVDFEKNRTHEWTHFRTHFSLCCARTKFRRCTLEALFISSTSRCPHEEALLLQKYSVIVSEGDVFQNCDKSIMYADCPGGDPRPPTKLLYKLMNAEGETTDIIQTKESGSRKNLASVVLIVNCLVKLCM